MKNKFKIGDTVKVIYNSDPIRIPNDVIGKIGVVNSVCIRNNHCGIDIVGIDKPWAYSLELFPHPL